MNKKVLEFLNQYHLAILLNGHTKLKNSFISNIANKYILDFPPISDFAK